MHQSHSLTHLLNYNHNPCVNIVTTTIPLCQLPYAIEYHYHAQ